MRVIVTFKNEAKMSPHLVLAVISIIRTQYTTKLITSRNKVQSFENNEVENMFLEDMGK